MKRRKGAAGKDADQLLINWSGATTAPAAMAASITPIAPSEPQAYSQASSPAPLTLILPWDFRTTFPQPTAQALEAGAILDEDITPENIRALHEEHAREMLCVLHDLDAVLDARRRGVDPVSNKAPKVEAAKQRLQKFFSTEPARLEQSFESLLAVYADVFGDEAGEAFEKAVRAWHGGVEVIGQKQATESTTKPSVEHPRDSANVMRPRQRRAAHRITLRLPVPRPLASAIAARHFGQEEDGKPIRPGPREVREITECHAEKLIELLDRDKPAISDGERWEVQEAFRNGIAKYADDFGQAAAEQLEAYVRRQAGLEPSCRRER